jgi:hypothetical protein
MSGETGGRGKGLETRFLHIQHHDFSLRMMKPGFSLHHDCREKQIFNAKSNVTKMVMLGSAPLHPTYKTRSLSLARNEATEALTLVNSGGRASRIAFPGSSLGKRKGKQDIYFLQHS